MIRVVVLIKSKMFSVQRGWSQYFYQDDCAAQAIVQIRIEDEYEEKSLARKILWRGDL